MPSSYTLGEHYEKFVRELVESGRYNSASEVLRDGLRLLEDAEVLRRVRTEELKQLIQEGLASGDAGPLDMEEIIAEAKRRKANRQDAA
ncbi:type II toxin-antitoxin system ParD family antitoxin [Devosia sp. A16]|uniref:type II toxin-antitoxin system ParD family antitoxin n=1 Tax=Devosia sp. A16 TaxID=1736675 RepID=UPI0006D7A68E|nr:type II toxin-antitoxin system ParD family antitoxin [Devosia sp. A16]